MYLLLWEVTLKMLFKLSLRNAKRSMKDYLVYSITMISIVAFMFAFNSLLFSDVIAKVAELLVIARYSIVGTTIFVSVIVAWLINYMVHFMLEKRSREFGTYLLLGMDKKQVSRLYMGENMILGVIAFVIGIAVGTVLMQFLMTIYYQMLSRKYYFRVECSLRCFLMTLGGFVLCYLLALLKNRKLFQKMSISDCMQMEHISEKINMGHERLKQWLLLISCGYFAIFYYQLTHARFTLTSVTVAILLFIISIYMFYHGLAAFLVCYIKKGGKKVFQRDGLFILRQYSSKIRTMRFTMGTLTILLTASILLGSFSMMLINQQRKSIRNAICFDIMVQSRNLNDNYKAERELLTKEGIKEKQSHIYHIYQEGSHEMNDYLYQHLDYLRDTFCNKDGSINQKKVEEEGYAYYPYDTFMKLSDYNYLRQMLGLEEIQLKDNQYCLHMKKRIYNSIEKNFIKQDKKLNNGNVLSFDGVNTEAFAQNGQNGADYIYIVPDQACNDMKEMYSMMVMNIKGKPADDLQSKLEKLYYHRRGVKTESEIMIMERDLNKQGIEQDEIHQRVAKEIEKLRQQSFPEGTELMMSPGGIMVGVKNHIELEMLVMISTAIFPLVYISLVFACVVLTILAVQQISDSSKYRYRYDILQKLGVSNREMSHIINKQLALYYLVPVVVSLLLSALLGNYAGERFVSFTGGEHIGIFYYAVSCAFFLLLFMLYFAATNIAFKRNVKQKMFRLE